MSGEGTGTGKARPDSDIRPAVAAEKAVERASGRLAMRAVWIVCGIAAGLASTVFGLTVANIKGDVVIVDKRVDVVGKSLGEQSTKIEVLQSRDQDRAERIRVIETTRHEDLRRFDSIERSQRRLEEKLDFQSQDIQKVLQRLPK